VLELRDYGTMEGGVEGGRWSVTVVVVKASLTASSSTTSVRRQPVRHRSAGSVRRSTARQIVSKLIEFVCPSSTRPQSAGSVRRSTARQIVSKLIEFVCPSSKPFGMKDSVRRRGRKGAL
jgi:hypothetical protein